MSNELKPFVPKTATDFQKLRLERLMANPDKPVPIPEPRAEKSFNVPEFVRNVMGSSAGAGSGEFHVYRHLRRKEYTRQKIIEEKSEKERLDEEFKQKLEKNKREMEERTLKRRRKRLKKKEKMKLRKKAKPLDVKDNSSCDKESSSDDSENESPAEFSQSENTGLVQANLTDENQLEKDSISEDTNLSHEFLTAKESSP